MTDSPLNQEKQRIVAEIQAVSKTYYYNGGIGIGAYTSQIISLLTALLAEIEKGVKELKGLPDFENYAVARKDVLALLHPSEPKED